MDAPVPAWRRLRRRCWWLLLLAVLGAAQRLPAGAARALGRALARAGLTLRPRERARAAANLARAYPQRTDAWRADLLAQAARRLGENLADTLRAPRLLATPGAVDEEPCPATGARPVGDVIAELAAPGRGVLLVTGHLGCWELLGGWLARELARRGLGPLGAVTGTVHNPPVDRLLQDRRRALGLLTLPRREGVRPLLRHLRAGGVAAVLMDQNTRAASVAAPFFGRPAPTPVGPVRLARRDGIPLLPVAIGRHGAGHRVVHRAPLDPAAPEAELLAACNAALEDMIRRNPAEWVWFHDRWERGDDDPATLV